ncbi:hypothetical protein [Sporolactobacillus sp. KGMB 08714]
MKPNAEKKILTADNFSPPQDLVIIRLFLSLVSHPPSTSSAGWVKED